MIRNSIAGLVVLSVLSIGHCARADLLLSVSQDPSSNANLNALNPGEQVTFDVTLSGLDAPEQLGFLGATLAFDPTLLGTPLSITPGPIVPDPSAFLMAPGQGSADGSYLFLFSNMESPISSNGIFFQFTVAAQDAYGSGNIAFTFISALDTSLMSVNIDSGPSLPFQVSPISAIPEPSTLLLAACACTCLSFRQARLRHCRNRMTAAD